MRLKREVTDDANGVPSIGEASFLLDSLYRQGVHCVHCLSPLFTILSFTASFHNTQPLVPVPQMGRILPGTVGEATSQSCHILRVTLQSLLCHTEL